MRTHDKKRSFLSVHSSSEMKYKRFQRSVWLALLLHGIIISGFFSQTSQGYVEDETFNLSCIPKELKGVLQEIWENNTQINSMKSLVQHKDYPGNPHRSGRINSFNASLAKPLTGQRLRAYLTVAESGLHNFKISCKTTCIFSFKAQRGNIHVKCQNKTTSLNLTAGRFYDITVLHIAGLSNHREVELSFVKPNGSSEGPISEENIVAYQNDGILGQFQPGEWASWEPCDMLTRMQKRYRQCQKFPPLYSGINSSFEFSQSKTCDPCPNGWVNCTGSCYRLVYHEHNVKWTNARKSCLNFNSDLLSITNKEEHLFIKKYLSDLGLNDTKSWTGLIGDVDGKWSWSDDSSLSYINKSLRLDREQPGCALISSSSWIITPCSKVRNISICKRKALFSETCLGFPLGMESGGIKAKQILSHSSFNWTLSPHQARLAGPGAWCSGKPSYGSLKIVFKMLHRFCAVATQGFWEEGYFSTNYRLRIGTDKLEEEYIGINDSQSNLLAGNSNPFKVHVNSLVDGVFGTSIKFVLDRNSYDGPFACLRVEIYGEPVPKPSGPTRAPQIDSVHQNGMTSVIVKWKHIEGYFFPGTQRGYKILFTQKGTINETFTLGSSPNTFEIKLPKEPQINTEYCLAVLAFDEYGNGPSSNRKCINLTFVDGTCPKSWMRHEYSCYLLLRGPEPWEKAKKTCISLRSQLATISNSGENNFIASMVNDRSWIGVQWNETVMGYAWVDGSAIDFNATWKNRQNDSSKCVCIREKRAGGDWDQLSCLQPSAFVCEKTVSYDTDNETCNNMALGFENGLFPNANITASSVLPGYWPGNARLAGNEAWCPSEFGSREYLEVRLGSPHVICAVATQGLHMRDNYTTAYKLQLSMNGSVWEWFNNGKGEVLKGNVNSFDVVKQEFKFAPTAQYVRFWPKNFSSRPCLRIEMFGNPVDTATDPPTGPPVNVSVAMATMEVAIISWSSQPSYYSSGDGSHKYKVSILEKGFNATKIFEVMETSMKFRGFSINSTYCVSLLAVNSFGDGPWSDCFTFKAASACLHGWFSFNEHCYRAYHNGFSWSDARHNCHSKNSELVVITSSAENEFAGSLVHPNSTCTWIGLEVFNRELHWISSFHGNFTRWHNEESKTTKHRRTCVNFHHQSRMWVNSSCSSKCHYICKRKDYKTSYSYCSKRPLGIENKAIPDSAFDFSHLQKPYSGHFPSVRLASDGGWCPSVNMDSLVFLRVSLQAVHIICAIGLQGNAKGYVSKYKLKLAIEDSGEEFSRENGEIKIYRVGKKYDEISKKGLEDGIAAKYVTFIPTHWKEKLCLRIEIYGKGHVEGGPTRAPENVSHWFVGDTLQVTWSPIPIRFQAYLLKGYVIATFKRNVRIAEWSEPANATNASKSGVKADEIDCVIVYGYNKYKGGYANSCPTIETPVWSSWSPWSKCSQTCGNGVMTRRRICPDCPENITQTGKCSLGKCSVYKPQAFLNVTNSTSNSFSIRWKPYSGEGTLIGYRVIVLKQSLRRRLVKREAITPTGEVVMNFSLPANVTSIEVGNLSASTKFCVRIGAILLESNEDMSECVYFYTEQAKIKAPTILSTTKINSTAYNITWQPVPDSGRGSIVLGYLISWHKVDDFSSSTNVSYKVRDDSEFYMTLNGFQPFTIYCIQVKALAQTAESPFSECVIVAPVDVLPAPNASIESQGPSAVIIQWEPPLRDLSDGILLGYYLFLRDRNTTTVTGPTATNASLPYSDCIQVAAFTIEGSGNFTECLSVRRPPPQTNLKISALSKMTTSTIKVYWAPLTFEDASIEVTGYELQYKLVKQNGTVVENSRREKFILCSELLEFLLTNLTSFSLYKIQMAGIFQNGSRTFSNIVYGETCACPEFITVSSTPQDLQTVDNTSHELTKVIESLFIDTCGYCKQYGRTTLVYSNSSKSEGITFPVTKTSYGQSDYSKFVPVIRVPGVALITRKKQLGVILTKVTGGSILDSWPIIIFTLVIAMLAGIIIWFLDSKTNPEHFPRQFIKGAGQGFWWSFISMTTVGYGDLCPKSILGKAFAIIWFLVGLVIFSVFMGALASLMTITTVRNTVAGMSSGVDSAKVAVVENSAEKRVALGPLSGKVVVGTALPNVKQLVEALKTEKVNSILVDMYTPAKRKDLFSGSWFEVSKLLKTEISQGVVLQGAALNLADALYKTVLEQKVQTQYLLEVKKDKGENFELETDGADSVTILEPDSPYFLTTLHVLGIAVATLFCCGLVYQIFYFKRTRYRPDERNRHNSVSPESENATITIAATVAMVEEFYNSFTATYKELRQKCQAEIIQLTRLKQQGSKSLLFKSGDRESKA